MEDGRIKSSVSCEQTHTAFPKEKLCNTGTGIPQLERHTASLWDLYLAFAMLLIKYFINNVNILDAERELSPVIPYALP